MLSPPTLGCSRAKSWAPLEFMYMNSARLREGFPALWPQLRGKEGCPSHLTSTAPG